MTRFDRIMISILMLCIFLIPAAVCISYGNH